MLSFSFEKEPLSFSSPWFFPPKSILRQQQAAILTLCVRDKMPKEMAEELRCSRSTVYRTLKCGTDEAPMRIRIGGPRSEELVEAVQCAPAKRAVHFNPL